MSLSDRPWLSAENDVEGLPWLDNNQKLPSDTSNVPKSNESVLSPSSSADNPSAISRPITKYTTDHRVKLKAKPLASERVYGPRDKSNVLYPLYETGGVIFPYTPTITNTYNAMWNQFDLVHTNYQPSTYSNSSLAEMFIVGEFSAGTQQDARYVYAVLHFFRTVTKMNYGVNDPYAGTPPPVLLLSGHGQGIYNDVPVVITSFTHEFTPDSNFVTIPMPDGQNYARLPVINRFSISCKIQPNTTVVRDKFNLEDFRSGKSLFNNDTKGYI